MKKLAETIKLPLLGHDILFKDHGSDQRIKAKVYGVFKKTTVYKNVRQIPLANGAKVEKDFLAEVEEWKSAGDLEDVLENEPSIEETYQKE